jgi:hypothetical protein
VIQGNTYHEPQKTRYTSFQEAHFANLQDAFAPGIERFEYFRKITRIAQGQEPPESLRDVQELYDTYFLKSPAWERAQSE